MYECDEAQCKTVRKCYVGRTTTLIKERFKQHASIKKHYKAVHHRNIPGSQMLPNVSVLTTTHDRRDLVLLEFILIKQHNNLINIQTEDFDNSLKIF